LPTGLRRRLAGDGVRPQLQVVCAERCYLYLMIENRVIGREDVG